MHTLEEPRLVGSRATVERTEHGARGQLNLDVLWPAADNADVSKVGGPGKEYWVFGKNYANDVPASRREKGSLETGDWRIEVSPKQAAAEDLFFTVMQTTDRTALKRLPVTRIEAGERVGCVIAGADATWIVLLRKDSQRSAAVVRINVPAANARGSLGRVLVTDLAAGRWEARRAGTSEVVAVEVGQESGAGWFEGAAGEWVLSRSAER
jgi:heparin/heparan-sulfate lyase